MPQRSLIVNDTSRKTHNTVLNTQLHPSLILLIHYASLILPFIPFLRPYSLTKQVRYILITMILVAPY